MIRKIELTAHFNDGTQVQAVVEHTALVMGGPAPGMLTVTPALEAMQDALFHGKPWAPVDKEDAR